MGSYGNVYISLIFFFFCADCVRLTDPVRLTVRLAYTEVDTEIARHCEFDTEIDSPCEVDRYCEVDIRCEVDRPCEIDRP